MGLTLTWIVRPFIALSPRSEVLSSRVSCTIVFALTTLLPAGLVISFRDSRLVVKRSNGLLCASDAYLWS